MGQITVKVVQTAKQKNDFIQFPNILYKDNAYYVPDMDVDVRKLLSDVTAFLAYDEQGRVVGRVTAFINDKANRTWNLRAVRFSHIDFIDDPDVAKALLDAVEDYARQKQMDTVMGPLGFYDFDKEGMLVEGFDRMSSIIEYYNAPYYATHLEKLGYQKEVDWVQTRFAIPNEVPKTFSRVAKYVREEEGLHVRKLTNKIILKEGYGRRVFQLFNDVFKHLFGFSEMPIKQIDYYINHYLSMVDKDLMPAVEDKDGNLIGACICMGTLNEATRKSKGRFLPFGWWHLAKALWYKHEESITLLLVGVKEEYQGMGVNALFFDDLIPILQRKGYKWAETGPQLETNTRVQSQWKPLNPEIVKRRRCYSKKID